MRVLCFQDWGAQKIKAGTKYSTIRRKANCKPGDTLSLRYWEGKPRRKGSKQVEFARVECLSVRPIKITEIGLEIDRKYFIVDPMYSIGIVGHIASQEGFSYWPSMKSFFKSHYGLPFVGEMIEWEPLEGE